MKKQIRRIEIEPAENGGHTVTHHYKEMPTHSIKHGIGTSFVVPERHVFGKGEGHDMLAHIADHLGIDAGEGEADEEGQKD